MDLPCLSHTVVPDFGLKSHEGTKEMLANRSWFAFPPSRSRVWTRSCCSLQFLFLWNCFCAAGNCTLEPHRAHGIAQGSDQLPAWHWFTGHAGILNLCTGTSNHCRRNIHEPSHQGGWLLVFSWSVGVYIRGF